MESHDQTQWPNTLPHPWYSIIHYKQLRPYLSPRSAQPSWRSSCHAQKNRLADPVRWSMCGQA